MRYYRWWTIIGMSDIIEDEMIILLLIFSFIKKECKINSHSFGSAGMCSYKKASYKTKMRWRCKKKLTTLILRMDYSVRYMSMPWLLMLWVLTSPYLQQRCYWLCKIKRIPGVLEEEFYCAMSVQRNKKWNEIEWYGKWINKWKCMFMFS